jgi:ribosomal protein S18 acetylase RimI-like enzyme
VRSIVEIEERFRCAWPAAEVEEIGGWRLRYMSGVSRRANSVWPGAGEAPRGASLEDRIARVEAFYTARGEPARFQIFPGAAPAGLDEVLAARGYAIESPVSVQVATAEQLARVAPREGAIHARVEATSTRAWWSLAGERSRFAHVPEVYRGLLGRLGPRAGYAIAERDGEPIATGLGVAERGFAGVFSMLTLPEHRGRGAGRALLAALARWAEARGVAHVHLQVERDNAAALALYSRAGFSELYGYHYRLRGDRPT